MKKSSVIMLVALFLIAGFATSSMAATVANTSQLGSLLVFPKIDTKANFNSLLVPQFDRDTIITIGNNGAREVTIQCFWTYPTIQNNIQATPAWEPTNPPSFLEFSRLGTGVQGWTKTIKPKSVIYFSAATGINDAFGLNLTTGGNAFPQKNGSLGSGALTCFAVKSTSIRRPISYNQLYGTAELINFTNAINDGDAPLTYLINGATAWKYTAWSFRANAKAGALMVNPDATQNPNTLALKGAKGTYDACPSVLTFNYIAKRTSPYYGPHDRGFVGTDVTLLPCTQDLRVNPVNGPRVDTKTLATFKLFNANGDNFDNTSACVNCWFEQFLGASYIPGRSYLDVNTGFYTVPDQDNIADPADPFYWPPGFQRQLASPYDVFTFSSTDDLLFSTLSGGIGTTYGRAEVEGVPGESINPGADGCVQGETTKQALLGVAYDYFDFLDNLGTPPGQFPAIIGPDGIPEVTAGTNMTGYGAQVGSINWTDEIKP